MKPNWKDRPKTEDYKLKEYGGLAALANLLGKLKHDYNVWSKAFEQQLREIYEQLCKTRVENIADDAVAFFIEKLLDQEPEEILGK